VLSFRCARARQKAAQAQFTIIHAVPYAALMAVKFPIFFGIGAALRLKRAGGGIRSKLTTVNATLNYCVVVVSGSRGEEKP
jgi:hypothetical protein